jgi:hypothetical protein
VTSRTIYLSPGATGYTSTLNARSQTTPGTVEVGYAQSYLTTTSYLNPGATAYTSTINLPSGTTPGTVELGFAQSLTTITTSLNPKFSGYTSTIAPSGTMPGTVVIGVQSTTSIQDATGYVTTTSYLMPGASGYSITVPPSGTRSGTVQVGIPQSITTTTSYLSPGASGYTSTVAPSGSNAGTVQVGVPQRYTTTTSYLSPGAQSYTSTVSPNGGVAGTVIQGVPQSYTTTTSFLSPGTSGYTSTVPPNSGVAGTVQVGYPQSYTTVYSYYTSTSGAVASTTTAAPPQGTTAGTVQVNYPQPYTTVTTTIPPAQSAYTTTVPAQGRSAQGTVIIGTPSAAPSGSFSCSPLGYLIQRASGSSTSTLYSVNITTGVITQLPVNFGSVTQSLNGMGFNILDNFLYAYSATGQVVRLTSTSATVISTQSNFATTYAAGDIDSSGNYWLLNASTGAWLQIDVRPGSSTFGQVIGSGTSTFPSGRRTIDWSYIPGQGEYMYAALGTTDSSATAINTFARWSLATKTWETLNTFPNLLGNYGAAYASNNGSMFVQSNDNGQIYRIDVPARAQPVLVARGPATSSNDGARCVYG